MIDSVPNNLPIQSTPFIGREALVSQAVEKLVHTEARLLVLTGSGGTGKTRLALQIAASVTDEFKDGVFFISLEAITKAEMVVKAIASELGLHERRRKPAASLLKEYINGKQILLVLDNFEQVLAAAPAVADLLSGCAWLKILVTSRELLHLQIEYDIRVPPLSLPDQNNEAESGLDFVSQLKQCEAIRFFAERSKAAQVDFELTNQNAPIIADICRRLDGLPLAIELTAARIRLLPPKTMLERLDGLLAFLTSGDKDRPVRHQTLRGTIDWSYNLLNKEERRIFRWLSVFAGGFTLEAAEEICHRNGALENVVLDHLTSLEEKSLIKRQGSPSFPRYAMLETVREYALERLKESVDADKARKKHAEYFVAFASEADPKLFGIEHAVWRNRLSGEHGNIRAVLEWSLGSEQQDLGLKLIVALDNYWQAGHVAEPLYWLDKVKADTPSRELSRMYSIAGHAACNLGDVARGMSLMEQGLCMCRDRGSNRGIAYSLALIGNWHFWLGDGEMAALYKEQAIAVAKEFGIDYVIPHALEILALIAAGKQDFERAHRLIEEALIQCDKESDDGRASTIRMSLALIALLQNNLELATSLAEARLKRVRRSGNAYSIAEAQLLLARISMKQDNAKKTKVLLADAISLFAEMAIKWRVAFGFEAVSHCLVLYAEIARSEGQMVRATRLLGAMEQIYEPVNLVMARWRESYDDLHSSACSELGAQKFEAIWKEGHVMTLEEAVDYALDEENRQIKKNEIGGIAGRRRSRPDELSNREIDVAVLLGEGLTNREIGERLYISERTVANHVQNILNKTSSRNRAEAAAYLIRNGLAP